MVDFSTEIDAQEVIQKLDEFCDAGIQLDNVSQKVPKNDWYEDCRDFLREYFTDDGVEDIFAQAADYHSVGIFFGSMTKEEAAGTINLPAARKALRKIKRELERSWGQSQKVPSTIRQQEADDQSVFVVHGHDEAVLHEVCRLISDLGLDPIVLREKPNMGATIIEKFERNANVGFAVVLMTPDDVGGSQADIELGNTLPRARQNVIMELGYFIAKLSRERVAVLKSATVEEPSDIFGVVYTEIDSGGAWKFSLGKELRSAGYEIDLNKI